MTVGRRSGIGTRRDVAARLVQQQIPMALGDLDAAAVDANVVARRHRPSCRARGSVAPLTVTRPSSISCSDARRDAMPACDRIFCRRSIQRLFITKPRISRSSRRPR